MLAMLVLDVLWTTFPKTKKKPSRLLIGGDGMQHIKKKLKKDLDHLKTLSQQPMLKLRISFIEVLVWPDQNIKMAGEHIKKKI